MYPFVLQDQRKRAAQLEKERERKRTAYAKKKKAEQLEYKQALKDARAGWAMTVAAHDICM